MPVDVVYGPTVDVVYGKGRDVDVVLGTSLVVAGSVAHAVWNLLVKRSGAAGTPFVWLYSALVTPALVVLLLVRAQVGDRLVTSSWWAAVVSAGLHTLYALVLQRSCASADLGVVYPVARAGAPVLVALASIPLLQARPPPALWLGIALICLGVPLLVGSRAGSPHAGLTGAMAGGATAVTIAAYTLWDGYAVTRLHVDVVSYLTVGSLAQLAVLTLVVAPQRGRLTAVARCSWRLALPVAVLVPTSYGLVLAALQHVDVQVVAAARSTSILAASLLASWVLHERLTPRRAAGAAVLAAGVAVAALGA